MSLALKDLHPEKLFLYSLVRLYEPETVVEVGVSQGKSAVALAMGLRDNKKGTLFAVDNWTRKHGGKAGNEVPAKKLLEENGCGKHVEFVSANSFDFFKSQKNHSFDFVHVDADHSYEGAIRDISEAIRISRTFVIVHDSVNLEDVTRACELFHGQPSSHAFFVKASRGYWMCEPFTHHVMTMGEIHVTA